MSTVLLQRAYEKPANAGSYRVLVDRLWPRGRSRDELHLDDHIPDLAPSAALRRWFAHDASRWDEFRKRYENELADGQAQERMRKLLKAAGEKSITLVYGAKDVQHNHAIVLRDALGLFQIGSS